MLKLKELREKAKISQAELAKYLNITQVQISKYELGKNEPDLNTTKKIASYFNVSIDYLLGTPEEDIILITKEDFEKIKTINKIATDIVKKIESQTNDSQTNNFKFGNNNSVQINNSFNKK